MPERSSRPPRRAGVVCAVGYQWRAVPAVGSLVELLRTEGLRFLASEGTGVTQARSWFKEKSLSGGLLAERASHHVDLQRHIGGEVVSVQAAASALAIGGSGHPEATDTETALALILQFASGALGSVQVLWVDEGYPSRHHLTALGSESRFELELDPVFALRRNAKPVSATEPLGGHAFAAGLLRFVEAVRRNDPSAVVCDARDAAGTLAVIVACERALTSGGAVAVERLTPEGAGP